jgi:dTDP-4-amino-4,6-dideoxygalactose transaminase
LALAIHGNQPRFAHPRHVGTPNIGDPERLAERIRGALERRWLTNNGPLVQEFEQRMATLVGVRHAIAVSSATTGIELVARALGLDGEVIVPSFTFVGTAHALTWVGATPVFAELDPATHTLDPADVQRRISPRTSAILGVHLWGRPCAVEALSALAERHDIPLIFDAAHALNCTKDGRPLGAFGTAEVFSFHATKVANSGEGGVITTNDDALAERLALTRAFGFRGYDDVLELGTNGKMSELNAATGLTSLEGLDRFVAANRANHETYREELADAPGLSLLTYDADERHNYHYVVVEVDAEAAAPLERDDLVAVLHAENVLARRYFYPGCHRLEPYRPAGASLPLTEEVASRVVVLPTGTAVSSNDVRLICAILREALSDPLAVRARLGV